MYTYVIDYAGNISDAIINNSCMTQTAEIYWKHTRNVGSATEGLLLWNVSWTADYGTICGAIASSKGNVPILTYLNESGKVRIYVHSEMWFISSEGTGWCLPIGDEEGCYTALLYEASYYSTNKWVWYGPRILLGDGVVWYNTGICELIDCEDSLFYCQGSWSTCAVYIKNRLVSKLIFRVIIYYHL